jgi:hypothetical protein
MTRCYATDFIKSRHRELEKELNDDFETITVRLEAKNALMLKALSQVYQFPVSTSFTDIISKHIADVLTSLNDEDFDTIVASSEKKHASEGSALDILRQYGIVPERVFFDIPDFSDEESSQDGGEGDSE